MRKIAEEIEEDIYKLVKASSVDYAISGVIYRNGMRPFNSRSEDVVISFIAGLDGQKQSGVVGVKIYVPNIDVGDNLLVKNTARCKALGIILNEFKESLTGSRINTERTGYWFAHGGDTIRTFEEKDINQHYINLRLEFEYLTI